MAARSFSCSFFILFERTDHLILMGVSCIAEERSRVALGHAKGSSRPLDRDNERARAYREQVRQLRPILLNQKRIGDPKIAYLDTYDILWDRREEIMPDGIHFNEEGEKLIFEGVRKIVENSFGLGITPDPKSGNYGHGMAISANVPLVLPYWKDVGQKVLEAGREKVVEKNSSEEAEGGEDKEGPMCKKMKPDKY